ncbi:MAG TPA: hypothetical protein VFP34_13370 [Microlunatus sp.]|nr:hypothetical protein [Microlunatus sp.]
MISDHSGTSLVAAAGGMAGRRLGTIVVVGRPVGVPRGLRDGVADGVAVPPDGPAVAGGELVEVADEVGRGPSLRVVGAVGEAGSLPPELPAPGVV